MAKVPVQFGEWRPDIALLDTQFASSVENVFATVNSYQPIPSLVPITTFALPGLCVGLGSARTPMGEWQIYAGTTTKLYKLTPTGWLDVSRTSGGNYHVDSEERWSWAQFGDNLIALNIDDPPQVISVSTPGARFAALGGSPPTAHNVTQFGDFIFLGGLSTNRRQLQWSAINNITGWTPGTGLSDLQELPDGGPVQGVTGDTIGYVVQDRAIRTLQFLPGDNVVVFQIARVVEDKGSISEFGYGNVANILYFLAEDGFYALSGNQLNPIGENKVNQWFLTNSDPGRRNIVQIITTNRPYVVWAYHSSPAAQTYDQIIIYNWAIQRWSRGTIYAQAWGMLSSLALDLDTDGSEPGDPDLDSTAMPLDSFFYIGGRPIVCAIDVNGILCSLTGPPLRAVMETAETHLIPGQRSFVSEVYPLVDGAAETVTAGMRERLQDKLMWNLPTPLEVTGSASLLTSSRLHRFRVTLPAGEDWSNAQGVLAEAQPDGAA